MEEGRKAASLPPAGCDRRGWDCQHSARAMPACRLPEPEPPFLLPAAAAESERDLFFPPYTPLRGPSVSQSVYLLRERTGVLVNAVSRESDREGGSFDESSGKYLSPYKMDTRWIQVEPRKENRVEVSTQWRTE